MKQAMLHPVLAFFNFGAQELLIILILLAFPAIVIAVVYFIVKAASKPSGPPPPKMGSREGKLLELESLRMKRLITDEEYHFRRQQIVDEL